MNDGLVSSTASIAISSSKSIAGTRNMDARTNFVVGSSEYCICWTGPICSNTDSSQPNPIDCMCGTNICGADDGRYCTASLNQCRLRPEKTCTSMEDNTLTKNPIACQCSSSVDCSDTTGQFCYTLKNGATSGCKTRAIISEGMLFNQVNINIGRPAGGAFSVVVSPDGKNVYVPLSGRIIYWIRNVDTGELTDEVKLITNNLDGASVAAVSPNGKNVFS